jgi:glycosyltransferase involved in cell wall biosynthesis
VAESDLSVGPGQDLVLTGPLADAEMPALFRLASALAMPSLREGFGLVVLEALACGTPVVVSDRAPFTEYLHDSAVAGHALYVDPLDVGAIADALRRAAEPARRAALARAVPAVCQRYSWAASAARHEAVYLAQRALAFGRAA